MTSDRVIRALRETPTLTLRRIVLAAVSGGADSMAMLSALYEERAALGIEVVAAHFDHGLRDASHDRDIVASYCAERSIALHVGKGDVRDRAGQHSESIEAAARHLRYAFLEATADTVGADCIATGHTISDQAETVVMRIGRGAGLRGLAGILAQRGRIIRPLLAVTGDDTVAHCRARGVRFVEDPTNTDRRFERNRIRHDVLPVWRTLAPHIDAELAALASDAVRALDDIRITTNERLTRGLVRERDGMWLLDVRAVVGLEAEVMQVLFADLLRTHVGSNAEFTRVHYQTLREMCAPAYHSGRSASLPGITVRREHNSLVFVTAPAERRYVPRTAIVVPGKTRIDENTIIVSRFVQTRGNNESGGSDRSTVAYFARDAIEFPLVVRSLKSGDRMRPRGMHGHSKKVSDILIDRKVPRRHRDRMLVVEDQSEIIWLVGEALGERGAISGQTRDLVSIGIEAPFASDRKLDGP